MRKSFIACEGFNIQEPATRGRSRARLFIAILLLSLLLPGCIFATDRTWKRKLKPYDPEKAGATIVESFNITGKINLSDYYYDVAEYNNEIYINNDGVIYVFDKGTFNKIREINYDLRDSGIRNNPRAGNGFIITAGGYAFLLCRAESRRLLYSLDLTTGETARMDTASFKELAFNSETPVDNYTDRIGYNTADDTVWFRSWQNYKPYYLFYRYDAEEERFIFLEQKVSPYYGDGLYSIGTIYGNYCWFDGCLSDPGNNIYDCGILKYNFENPEEELHFIDAEYLNTLTVPQSTHYDGEHIWLMVERNKQIQMLKLLPRG